VLPGSEEVDKLDIDHHYALILDHLQNLFRSHGTRHPPGRLGAADPFKSFCARRTSAGDGTISGKRRIEVIASSARRRRYDNHPIFHEIVRNATPSQAASAAQIAGNQVLSSGRGQGTLNCPQLPWRWPFASLPVAIKSARFTRRITLSKINAVVVRLR
jgi:hypothetical protein